ncbi:hypothetical protein QWJ34_06680 [Saccharibacillus sp. CPCC 101409]|nr:hypothetical protein [Saccharibacillus sp. CPCC 101409]MDO3409442.1 hypothetical protein [Saccharibacillus sp. CPCC 101409]
MKKSHYWIDTAAGRLMQGETVLAEQQSELPSLQELGRLLFLHH